MTDILSKHFSARSRPLGSLALGALFGVAISTLGCGTQADPEGPVEYPAKALSTIQSQNGALSIEVRTGPSQPPARGETTVQFIVTDSTGAPVDGLSITPQLWMTDMGHGASVEPTVTADGDGKYEFKQCELFMPGRWELRTSIAGAVHEGSAESSPDKATALFQIP